MTEFSGSALYLAWIHPAGTLVMSPDYREFSFEPGRKTIDTTAGSDTFQQSIAGIGVPGPVSVKGVMQTAGTAMITALANATVGTLIAGIEGTATNKPKLTIPAISGGMKYKIVYDGICEFNVDFEQSAQHTEGAW